MGKCTSCTHYRVANPKNAPAVALSWLADSGEPEVYEELKRISEEEYERSQGEEQKQLEYRMEAISRLDEFQFQYASPPQFTEEQKADFNQQVKSRLRFQFSREPATVTHCAVHASRNCFYIAEIKNWAETCTDYEPRSHVPVCRKCLYYETSDMEARKRSESTAIISLIGSNDRDAASVLEQRAGEIDKAIGPAKAHDLRTAWNSRGRVHERLAFLPFCHAPCPKCSTRDTPDLDCEICNGEGEQMAQPEVFNRFLGCQFFRQAQPAQQTSDPIAAVRDSRPAAQENGSASACAEALSGAAPHRMPEAPPVNTSQPEQRRTLLGQLGLSPFSSPPPQAGGAQQLAGTAGVVQSLAGQAIAMIFDKVKEIHLSGVAPSPNRDPAEIPEESITILASGEPPLTSEMLRRSVAVANELIGGAMPAQAQRDYSAFIGKTWRDGNAGLIRMQLEFIGMYSEDRADPEWKPRAKALFQSMAAHATGRAQTGAARMCASGHENAPGNRFCGICGKPVREAGNE